MDSNLKERLRRIEAQIEVVYQAEEQYLTLDAAEDHQLAVLIAKADATSHAAKEMLAKSTPEWAEFKKSLAIAKAKFNREKHILELKNGAYQAEYLSAKMEAEAIKRGVG